MAVAKQDEAMKSVAIQTQDIDQTRQKRRVRRQQFMNRALLYLLLSLISYLRWLDTFLPLIVPNFFGGSPFFIFLIRQFYATIPLDLDEAAEIDGAGYLRIW